MASQKNVWLWVFAGAAFIGLLLAAGAAQAKGNGPTTPTDPGKPGKPPIDKPPKRGPGRPDVKKPPKTGPAKPPIEKPAKQTVLEVLDEWEQNDPSVEAF